MEIGSGTRYRIVSSQMTAELGRQVIVLELQHGKYFGLNEIAAAIWRLLHQPRTLPEIEQEILSQYNVPREQCRIDICRLLSELLSAHIIEAIS